MLAADQASRDLAVIIQEMRATLGPRFPYEPAPPALVNDWATRLDAIQWALRRAQ